MLRAICCDRGSPGHRHRSNPSNSYRASWASAQSKNWSRVMVGTRTVALMGNTIPENQRIVPRFPAALSTDNTSWIGHGCSTRADNAGMAMATGRRCAPAGRELSLGTEWPEHPATWSLLAQAARGHHAALTEFPASSAVKAAEDASSGQTCLIWKARRSGRRRRVCWTTAQWLRSTDGEIHGGRAA